MRFAFRSPVALLALLAALAFGVVAVVPAGADPGAVAVSAKKKKMKCKGKKKGKKSASAAKKCKGKKKGKKGPAGQNGPNGPTGNQGGPEIAIGDYYCTYGSLQVQPGNRYTVNNGNPGSYTYDPGTGIVNFQGGSYATFFGKYDPDPQKQTLDLFSAINDPPVQIGDYAWTCDI